MGDKSDNDEIYRVETVPPPGGGEDGDAYSAPTKVGPASSDAWAELIRKANEEGQRQVSAPPAPPSSRSPTSAPVSQKPASLGRSGIAPAPKSGPLSARSGPASARAPEPALPKVYGDDEDEAATQLSTSATPQRAMREPASEPPLSVRSPNLAAVAGAVRAASPSRAPTPAPQASARPTPAPPPVAPAPPPVAPAPSPVAAHAAAHAAPTPAPPATASPQRKSWPPRPPAVAPPAVTSLPFGPGGQVARAAQEPPRTRTGFTVVVAVLCMAVFVIGLLLFVYAR